MHAPHASRPYGQASAVCSQKLNRARTKAYAEDSNQIKSNQTIITIIITTTTTTTTTSTIRITRTPGLVLARTLTLVVNRRVQSLRVRSSSRL